LVRCGQPEVLPPGPRFVYITLFDVGKNTNLEFHNEILCICKAFTLQGELTSTKVNLTESIWGLTRRYNWVLLLK